MITPFRVLKSMTIIGSRKMKFFDEEKVCWADILFWLFVVAIIGVSAYGAFIWFMNFFSR